VITSRRSSLALARALSLSPCMYAHSVVKSIAVVLSSNSVPPYLPPSDLSSEQKDVTFVFVHRTNGERESKRRVREQLSTGDSKSLKSKSLKDFKASLLFDSRTCLLSLTLFLESTRKERRGREQLPTQRRVGREHRRAQAKEHAPHTLKLHTHTCERARKPSEASRQSPQKNSHLPTSNHENKGGAR